ncbi:aldehyde dehydrogenase family protein [bacterium (Candidatus Blackallbacteria) CG17_big_fil_post_rev_8_21_14_2_50_48_46]|uniref:aldehyde dehydrogenase (NAD(+)) n=1 Tax=bacterium (Candidatus Blackallbacteria) CG17_big_fil_post_rev_8_21_14_2_50_48_46 TaxID=2014261 RepID=A0A2M7G093_9BACT|nr:MAG: aldehyde dehydrogenase family protein [bacterium (Candidatus Blackallbacteria) CG18_big_fil_WC_8_21_14_2_50_49_26]PIW15090.1 MAG: aldehyde dehydrogenase family protein [bacterium (Candidatus Blackallbacteria) CG17_big_fil_post_rev_8_21_14_2_50_48_46]PIW47587.1 MAG: aldehyde dehydrogenase family protein [bacterium (Candidatus Blackallbacteria) CG13_big_fil_rev_8_21_14_2_50_49_14]
MQNIQELLTSLGIEKLSSPCSTGLNWFGNTESQIESVSPVDAKVIGNIGKASPSDYETLIQTAEKAKGPWASMPAPKRGEIVRQIGNALREAKEDLGMLVSYEMGKSYQEGLGEVQEMIDICDFAVGLSRQLYGLTMHSERPNHRMYEQWHPLGVVGIISAFNFPVAVWAWNSMIAAVCGDVSIWKPSEKTPLTAVACFHIMAKVLKDNHVPEGVMNLIVGDVHPIGETLIADPRVALISATGSTRMGKRVGEVVGGRLGKAILELGGNNAIILTPDADLKMALPAIVFGAVGTCGQRCTSTRRLIIHDSIYAKVKEIILNAYQGLKIGNPLDQDNHVGPLIDQDAVEIMQKALQAVKAQGGEVVYGGQRLEGPGFESGCYVMPAVAEVKPEMEIVQNETFAPILYLTRYSGDVTEAIAIQNQVKQGLSSAIFTTNMRESERFLSCMGSDCGIANVNIGTSGAEIGGAFGGEKETGGGRESGSDAWKAYMRRQTNTINYGSDLPLAQGIKFDI